MITSSYIRVAVLASVLTVAAERPGEAAVINVPEGFETITEALEGAEWGDTILVGPGIYKESIVLTDQAGDGVILKSTNGPGETTIAYGEVASVNEAVVTFQRCTNSTQLIGFSIDGRGTAKRGILANSESKPVLTDLVVEGAHYGIASHRSSYPYVLDVTIRKSSIAGLFIQGGSADVKGCTFTAGEKFGVYIRGTADPVRLRDCRITDNGQVGVQATDGEFTVEGGVVSGNGDTGLILQDVSPLVSGVTIEGHANIGIVMEASSATIQNCTIRENGFGAVVSIEGEPKISSCTFENNPSYHVGIEGDANPTIGGTLLLANRFVGEASFSVQSSSSQRVVATQNYWDKPCAPKDIFQVTGGGRLIRKPWASPDLEREFDDCTAARKYHKKWREGKLPTSPPEAIAQAEAEAAKAAAKAKRRAEREAARAAAEAAKAEAGGESENGG
jgi:parallel beta-helix repeat protein